MRMLVMGASGLMGANLVMHARDRGEEVAAVYHKYSVGLADVQSEMANVTDERVVSDLIRRQRPDWIIHCAAATNVDWCEEHPTEAYRVNTEATRNLAREARKVGSGMVYISTDSVFDGKDGDYSEEDAPAPLNVYAASKLAGEKAAQAEVDSCLVIRTNIYGWNTQNKFSLAEWALDRLESHRIVPGFEDVFFSPIMVNNLCEAIIDLIMLRTSGIYHVAGSESCSKYFFAQSIAEVFGLDQELVQPISIASSTLNALRPVNTSLNSGKVAQTLHRSMPDVITGLQRFKELRDSGYVTRLKGMTTGPVGGLGRGKA